MGNIFRNLPFHFCLVFLEAIEHSWDLRGRRLIRVFWTGCHFQLNKNPKYCKIYIFLGFHILLQSEKHEISISHQLFMKFLKFCTKCVLSQSNFHRYSFREKCCPPSVMLECIKWNRRQLFKFFMVLKTKVERHEYAFECICGFKNCMRIYACFAAMQDARIPSKSIQK